MKTNLTRLWPVLALGLFVTACDTDDDTPLVTADEFSQLESEWVRLTLLRDDHIAVLQPSTGEIVDSVDVALPEGARYYTSNSGRYLVVTERADNRLRFFDSGVINHVDHGHQQNVGWLDVTVDAPLPTHYASSDGEMVIFNDGDGSITHVVEDRLELPNYEPRVFTFPTVAHHGAGFRLDDGQFVTTFKDTDEPGGIPQMVKYLTADGELIDDNGGVVVAGIHGDATNGRHGVFGATDGIIVVDNDNNIDLIPNPEELKPERGFWVGSLKGHDDLSVFYGRAGAVGTYRIDPAAKTLTPVYLGDDVVGDMLSFDGRYYVVHTADNRVRVYEAASGNLLAEREVEMVDIPDHRTGEPMTPIQELDETEEADPVLVASDKHLYILGPNRVDIKVLSLDKLEHVHTIRLDEPVQSIAKNGFTEV